MTDTYALDDLLLPFDHTALGVHLEYERMGNQPVSDLLQERADAAGIEFQHLGLTLGTVVHNVDLRVAPSAELTGLLRDTLLERKVMFFRE